MTNRVCDFQALVRVPSADDRHRNEFRRAFGIANDPLRQLAGYGEDAVTQSRIPTTLFRIDDRIPSSAGGHQHERVVRRCVAIYSNSIETGVSGLFNELVEAVARDSSIGSDVSQHRGHV